MKKRILSLLLVFIMLLGTLPMGVMAAGDEGDPSAWLAQAEKTVQISTSYFYNSFVMPRKTLNVASDLAEQYGYKDKSGVVTALDVLVAVHKEVLGAEVFTKEDANTYLTVSDSGFLTNAFGDGTGNISVAVNGRMAVDTDSEYDKSTGGYTGYSIPQTDVPDNAVVEFFSAQDSYYKDYYTWFEKDGSKTEALSVTVGKSFELALKGYMFTWYGAYNDEELAASIEAVENAQLAAIGSNGDAFVDIEGKKTDEAGAVTLSFSRPGTYILSAYVTDEDIEAYATPIYAPWCKVTVTLPDASITAPADAVVFVGEKTGGKHYVPFAEKTAAATVDNENGTKTYYYDLTNNSTYNYRISGEDYVTYAGTFKKTANYSLTVTESDLKPEGKTKTTVDHDVTSNSGYNVADIYLNINAQNYLKMAQAGDTYQLVNLRNWEAVDSTTSNYFIEPDYHYTVINESGNTDNSVVTVSDSGVVTAAGEGTAIVLVTYDAININGAAGGPFFGAIWPENTGVFVVSVGAQDSGITTGMTINETINAGLSFKNDGTAVDAEHDVIYFTGDTGSYTFTPGTAGVTVTVANPTVGETMTFSGFTAEGVTTENGAVTVPLKEGRNIVKLEKDGKAEYQVITAKQVTVSINNGQPVTPGGTVTIKFNTVYHPINKLAGVYNYTPAMVYTQVEGYEGKMVGSKGSQYQFAATEAAQTVSNFMTTKELWGSTQLSTGAAFTIPADYANDTLTLSGGTIGFGGWGSWAGEHRRITLESGKLPNLNAASPFGYLGQLPDIVIPITITDAELDSIALTTDGVKTQYYVGDTFDTTNLVVTANYADDKTQTATNYSVAPQVLTEDTNEVTITYRGKTATIPVTVAPLKVTEIEVTTPPAKTQYNAGDVFDPTGMVVTATYNNGKTAPVTSYTYEPKRTLTESDTAMTVTYTGSDAADGLRSVTQAITVAAAPVQPEQPKTVTVSFTLLGDSKHGEPMDSAGTHTLKANNLETWIAKTNVTVPQGSKVIDVMVKALGIAGIPYENPTGNYVSSIRGMAEFTNGTYSGWMYTLNGTHPTLGVAEQTVNNGDTIVFHYTDDYTVEQGSENWGPAPTPEKKPATSEGTTVAPEVTVTNGEAKAEVSEKNVADAITAAKKDGTSAIVIAPVVKGDANKVAVELPTNAVKDIVSGTDAALNVQTAVGALNIPNDTLAEIVKAAGTANISMSVEKADGAVVKEKLPETAKVDGAVAVEFKITSGSKTISSFGGKSLEVSVPVSSKDHTNGKSYVAFIISDDGTVEKTVAAIKNGAAILTMRHFSTVVVTKEETAAFTDVAAGEYYYDAVLWAFAKGITDGTSATTFSPAAGCTRAQMVTFLWRAADCPEPTAKTSIFTDVDETAYYFKALLWAVENGITDGTSTTTFSPDMTCTRAQMAAFLWRNAKRPAVSGTSAFTDVKAGEYYSDAVVWLAQQGITDGTTKTTFSPDAACTRGQMVTFLYRYLGK